MVIRSIRVKSFMSLCDTEIEDIPDTGVLLVRGSTDGDPTRSNGSGKSSLLESVYWALTGKLLRGARPEKKWHVELEGILQNNHPFYLLRSNGQYILRVGDQSLETRMVSEFQSEVDRLLLRSTPYSVLQSLSFLSPYNISDWFSKMSDRERKNLLSSVLGISWLDSVDEELRESEKVLQNNLHQLEMRVSNLMGRVEQLLEQKKAKSSLSPPDPTQVIKVLGEVRSTFPEDTGELLGRVEAEGLSQEILKPIRELLQSLIQRVQNQVSETNSVLSSLVGRRQSLLERINHENHLIEIIRTENRCPTCGRPFEGDADSLVVEKKQTIESLKQEAQAVSTEIRDTQAVLQFQNAILLQLNSALSTVRSYEASLSQYYRMVVEQETQSDDETRRLMAELEKAVSERDKVVSELEEVRLWRRIFSPSGVKAVVVDEVLRDANEWAQSVGEYLGIPVSLEVDEKGRIDVSGYKRLSSGERRRAELAVLFALRSVLPTPLNMVVLDEVFDHLDQKGIEMVVPLVQFLSQDHQVWLITHRQDMLYPSPSRTVIVEKDTTTGCSEVRAQWRGDGLSTSRTKI